MQICLIVSTNLSLECFFVAENMANNLRVEEDDGEHGEEVGKDKDEEDEHPVFHRDGKIVEGAASEISFGHEASPVLKQRHQGPGQSVAPGHHHHNDRLLLAHFAVHGVGNVPVTRATTIRLATKYLFSLYLYLS
jgi:hypothetical protein